MAEDVGELGLEGINKITDKYFGKHPPHSQPTFGLYHTARFCLTIYLTTQTPSTTTPASPSSGRTRNIQRIRTTRAARAVQRSRKPTTDAPVQSTAIATPAKRPRDHRATTTNGKKL